MAYTTINKPTDYFNTKLYTGTGSSNSITGVGFQPDLTWIKSRSNAYEHKLTDVVRGVTKELHSNDTSAESTDANGLTAFDSDGFTVGSTTGFNGSSATFTSWNWKAGNSAGSSNTDGSITSTVSADTTAGFSIFTFTGTGANATVGHGLGAVPKMFIVRRVDSGNNWRVYHHSIGNTKMLSLEQNASSSTQSNFTNSTDPTSSVISLGTLGSANASGGTMVCYAFAEKKGYSKFGIYKGNGNSSGSFVYTGFKPAWVMIKKTSGTGNWAINDTKRDFNSTYGNDASIYANSNGAETSSSSLNIDLLSNGMKLRSNNSSYNGSGGSYVYMAFAAEPIVANVGNGIPATAR